MENARQADQGKDGSTRCTPTYEPQDFTLTKLSTGKNGRLALEEPTLLQSGTKAKEKEEEEDFFLRNLKYLYWFRKKFKYKGVELVRLR